MIIARILGSVVSTQKDERLHGKKLLIVRPINVDGSDTTGYVVAAIFYLIFCYGMSRYARAMEARLAKGGRR